MYIIKNKFLCCIYLLNNRKIRSPLVIHKSEYYLSIQKNYVLFQILYQKIRKLLQQVLFDSL